VLFVASVRESFRLLICRVLLGLSQLRLFEKHLENRVTERTKQLEEANRKLSGAMTEAEEARDEAKRGARATQEFLRFQTRKS
jgi:hypothetical protein